MTNKTLAAVTFFAILVGCNCASLPNRKDGALFHLPDPRVQALFGLELMAERSESRTGEAGQNAAVPRKAAVSEEGFPTEKMWQKYTRLTRGLCQRADREDDRLVFYRSVNCSDILRYNNGVYPWYPEAKCTTKEADGVTIYDCKDVTDKQELARYHLRHCVSVEDRPFIVLWCDPKRGGVPPEFFR